jgi:hypothetical protein
LVLLTIKKLWRQLTVSKATIEDKKMQEISFTFGVGKTQRIASHVKSSTVLDVLQPYPVIIPFYWGSYIPQKSFKSDKNQSISKVMYCIHQVILPCAAIRYVSDGIFLNNIHIMKSIPPPGARENKIYTTKLPPTLRLVMELLHSH